MNIKGRNAAAISIAAGLIIAFEGVMLTGYLDPVDIPTKCVGDTTDVIVGQAYSSEECTASLEKQIEAHAGPILRCTPILAGTTFQLASAISFGYNIGVGAYCGSDTAKRFNKHDFKGACKAMNENDKGGPQWVYAKGKVLPGLVTRRAQERKICEVGL